MTEPVVDRWSRRFVATSVLFLVVWQAAAFLGVSRRPRIVLAIFGFILHVVFGKAYTLIPSYFNSKLHDARALPLHLALSITGVLLLTLGVLPGHQLLAMAGSVLWVFGAFVFVVTLFWSVRHNLLGRETGTSDANRERRDVDRFSNAFMPVALLYLAFGSYELFSLYTWLPGFLDGYFPRISHLLAAGFAALLLFSIGFRLLPRFLVEHPPKTLVGIVLPSGAVAPLLLAVSLGDGVLFIVGALLMAVAVTGFALVITLMYLRSDRVRTGFQSVLLGAAAGVSAVSLGLMFTFVRIEPGLVALHARLNLLGFLGLSIVGVIYQFYPPNVGDFYRSDNTTALLSILLLAGGLSIEAFGRLLIIPIFVSIGMFTVLLGSLVYAYLILGLFYIHQRE